MNCCPRSAQCQCSLADVSVWCLCDVAGQEHSAVALSRLNETRGHGTQTRHHVSIRSAVCMHDVCLTRRLCDWACDDGLMSGWRGEFCIGHNVFGMRCCFKLNWAGWWYHWTQWWTAFNWKLTAFNLPTIVFPIVLLHYWQAIFLFDTLKLLWLDCINKGDLWYRTSRDTESLWTRMLLSSFISAYQFQHLACK